MPLNRDWTHTIDTGKERPNARVYEALIQQTVGDYNRRLASTPEYAAADWKLIRAMIWVESGGPMTLAWTGRVMQIGNHGDPGLSSLRDHEGATTIVVSQATLDKLASATAATVNEPLFNIELGIAYLWVRMSRSDIGPSPADAQPSSPGAAPRPRARPGRRITGWRAFTPDVIAQRYNIGDPSYAEKLRYVMGALGDWQ